MSRASLLLALSCILVGCVPFLEQTPKPKPCQVIVYDDQKHGECISREAMRRWVCKNLGCSE